MKERDCSLRLAPGEQNRSERNAFEPAGRADGRRSRKQCSDTKIRGAKLRGATRSADSRRVNTAEINAAWKNRRSTSNGHGKSANCDPSKSVKVNFQSAIGKSSTVALKSQADSQSNAYSVKWRINLKTGFGRRSAGGNSGAQTERRRERSRSATPPPSRRLKPPLMRTIKCSS